MNLNCCILENELIYIDHLMKLLRQWQNETGCDLSVDTLCSASELYEAISQKHYDILFIDIVLNNGENGIDVAKKLRSESYSGDLVFLTNFQDYVFEGYPVHALDYLIKPASYEKIRHCMNQVLEKLSGNCFFYRIRDSVLQIPYQNILYFSSRNHSTDIITTQKCYPVPQTLRNLLKILPEQFVQCHRTVIVNLTHIEFMNNTEILLSNQERIPIGRTYLKKLQQDIISLMQERRSLQ
ncbi:MAG: LytTR family DNA-binding domain-containing protein [Lachnospiraceae bacterium]|nr:LytTR family DNA-binding domain-containing protein [Lachnospiraceae bacterium]MDY4969745.1 LytTR family DNA-binding domain-containing protein [Lachnospiraceae bacterium]